MLIMEDLCMKYVDLNYVVFFYISCENLDVFLYFKINLYYGKKNMSNFEVKLTNSILNKPQLKSQVIDCYDSHNNRLPKLHRDILLISLYEYIDIKKAYSAVLRLNAIDHLSINIVNPCGEMVFFSSTPYVDINIYSSDLWLYDASIHPVTYQNKKFYWWDDCYLPKMGKILKQEKERKNNLQCGFVCAKKVENFYLLYSYATKEKDPEIKKVIEEYQTTFVDMGDYCYSRIRTIYEKYAGNYQPPLINKNNFPKQYSNNDSN